MWIGATTAATAYSISPRDISVAGIALDASSRGRASPLEDIVADGQMLFAQNQSFLFRPV